MKNILRSLLIPVAILVVSALLFGAGFYARGLYDGKQERAASKVATQFIDSVLAGNASTAYDLMSPGYQEILGKEAFAQVAESMKSDNPTKGEAITVKTNDGSVFYYQQVSGLDKNPSGKSEVNFTITLTETDGKMKVNNAALL